LGAALFVTPDKRRNDGEQQEGVAEADDGEQADRNGPAVAELLQPVPRPVPGERQEQQELGYHRDQPHPPGKDPELPVLVAADQREQ
jgi:hypothetical protein